MEGKNKSFPLEKILTITATEYANMKDVGLSKQIPIGVRAVANDMYVSEEFARMVPLMAEAVVGYRASITSVVENGVIYIRTTAEGTALIKR